jgi:sugar transferase (PEP-CTERM/EpsH1 system associated)
MAQYVFGVNKAKIIDFVDIDFEKWFMYYEKSYFPKSIIFKMEYKRLKKFENYINENFDCSIVISEREKSLLFKQDKVIVVSNGVDYNKFSPMEFYEKETIIFSGAMNYFANVDGVLFFYEEIFPLVKNEVPDAKFIIAGMNPVKKIRQLACKDVIVTGYVPDIRSYVARSMVFVAPLRIAKGLQNKVLEAMAMEVPVVATGVANRGIGAQDHQELLVADSPGEFAQATIALLRDATLRKALTANAKRFVLQHFQWEKNLCRLDDVIALFSETPTGKV